ncbi:UNVERIFIED_CONTAM: GEM-like protein 5 [Sesamum calycinum]|uniref:GEM-like protein 5 n=1 Tax=Sesamum calycinum TaxID=2727403 RepID=A0AAW2MLB1_9LAMI
MGTPAVPTCHPNNQKAALWGAGAADQKDYQNHHHPYIQYTPIETSTTTPLTLFSRNSTLGAPRLSPLPTTFGTTVLKTGSSVSGAAWGKVNLRAKTITGGGFEALYKQTFATYPNETLKKTFACYLSTSTGPVAGTSISLLSTSLFAAIALCPSPHRLGRRLGAITSINPVVMRDNPTERYIQLVSIDGHDFWFMGFVNYEKATHHLFESFSSFAASGVPVPIPHYHAQNPESAAQH